MKRLVTLLLFYIICLSAAYSESGWHYKAVSQPDTCKHFWLRSYKNFAWIHSDFSWGSCYFRSTDYGETWSRFFTYTVNKTVSDERDYYRDFVFLDSANGFFLKHRAFLEERPNYEIYKDEAFDKTTDGGKTFEVVHLDTTDIYLNTIEHIGKDFIYAGGGNGVYKASAVFVKSTDGGKSWTKIYLDTLNQWVIRRLYEITDMSFISPDTGWISTTQDIRRTNDGGRTWTDQYMDTIKEYGEIPSIVSLQMINKDTGWAIGGEYRYILRTTNGGLEWKRYDWKYPGEWFYKIYFYNNKLGWVIGKSIFKTTNGGKTWFRQKTDMPEVKNMMDSYYHISMTDDSTGYITGGGFRLFITHNGGGPPEDFKVRIDKHGRNFICDGESLYLTAYPDSSRFTYLWSTGETTRTITVRKPGMYTVTVTDPLVDLSHTDSVYVDVITVQAKIIASSNLCKGSDVVLSAYPEGSGFTYLWSTGDTTQKITVDKPGAYSVVVSYMNTCSDSTSIDVESYPMPEVSIAAEGRLCENCDIVLKAEPYNPEYKYYWSTGDSASRIYPRKAGAYTVTAETKYGCRKTSDTVVIHSNPSAEIIIEGKPCMASSPKLKAADQSPRNKYKWSTGETTSGIVPAISGIYSLIVENEFGCSDTSSVTLYDNPQVSITGSDTLCKGKTVTLESDREFSSYLWSTGETTRSITVDKEGTYSLVATDANGCECSSSIVVREYETNLSGMTDIDFGMSDDGISKVSKIVLTNLAKNEITIEKVYFENSPSQFVSGTSQPMPAILQPGQTIEIQVSFNPFILGNYEAKLVVEVNSPCPTVYTSIIKASSVGRATVLIPDTSGYVGDYNFSMPLYAFQAYPFAISGNLGYTATIHFDKSVLSPNYPSGGTLRNGNLYFSFSGDNIEFANGMAKLGEVRGLILLPDEPVTPFIIDDFKWNTDRINTTVKNGSLTVSGVCQQNLSKIRTFGLPSLSITPNPAGSEATLHISGDIKGMINLSIYTMAGTRLESKKLERQKEETEININLENLSSGIYQIIATIEGNTIAEKLVVIK